jgi:hypothetical protein
MGDASRQTKRRNGVKKLGPASVGLLWLVATLLILGPAGGTASAQTPVVRGWSGVVSVTEQHVEPLASSDATTLPYPMGVTTGSYSFVARFEGGQDENGNTPGTAEGTFEESTDHANFFCYSTTAHRQGSGNGPVALVDGAENRYPMQVTSFQIPLHTVLTGGNPDCAADTTDQFPLGGIDDSHLIDPETPTTEPLDVLSGTRTYEDPPKVVDVVELDHVVDGEAQHHNLTVTRSFTITWKLTRLPDGNHDGIPDGAAGPAATQGGKSKNSNRAPGPVVRPTKQRSTVVAAIPTVKDVSKNGKVIAINLIVVAILMLLIVFPAQLFNSTLDEHYDEVRGWFRPPWKRGKPEAPRPAPAEIPRPKRLALYLGFVAATAVLHGFLDPKFGFDAASATLIVGLVIGIPIVTLVSNSASLMYARVKENDRGVMRVLPGTLLVGVVCVLVSRLAHFAPGYMYGLIAGFVFSRQLTKQEQGRRTAITVAWALLASMVAWLVLSPLQGHVLHGVPGFFWEIVLSSLTSIFLGGIEGMALGLVPMRTLPGAKVFGWSKVAWAGLFGFTLFVFVHLLLHPQSGFGSSDHPTPLFTWLGLFIGFGLVSVAFWGYFRFRPEHHEPAPIPQ